MLRSAAMGEIQEPGPPAPRPELRVTVEGERKPCPKCGGERTVRARRVGMEAWLRCMDCGVEYHGVSGRAVKGGRLGVLIGVIAFVAAWALVRMLVRR